MTKLKGQLTTAESAAATAKTEHDKIVADLNAKVADLEGKLKARNPILPVGSTGAGTGAGATGGGAGATAEWNAAIASLKASGLSQQEAVQQLVRDNPALHQSYLAEVNAGRGQ